MIKSLRFLFVALMAMIFVPSFAQELTLDFTDSENNPWGLPTDYTKTAGQYTYNDITISFGASNNGHKIHKDGYLIFGKKDATMSLPAFSFDVDRIDIVGRDGASGATLQNIYVGDVAVSTETQGSTTTNMYNIADDYKAAGNVYTLKINSAHNTQITKILIWKKGSASKKSPGLSWGTNSRTVTINATDNVFPTLTNENNLSVDYESTNPDVATIAEDGIITLKSAGKTVIYAKFAGNDEYEAQEVFYTLTVKEAIDPNAKGQQNNPYLLTDDEFFAFVQPLDTVTNPKSAKIYVKGYITNIEQVDTAYGNANFKIAAIQGDYDANIKLYAFRCYYLENAKFKDVNKIKVDDEVVLYGQIQYYGTGESRQPQFVSGYIYSLNGKITEPKYTITITNTEHGSLTLDKYEAAAGEKVSVTGMSTDDGWEMNEPTITAENGTEVEIGGSDEEGHYLIMPASNVTIALNITQLFTITTVFDSTQGDVTGISFDSEKNPIYKGAGKNVKFTVTPKDGFEVNSVTAADSDSNPIPVNIAQDKSYYEFEMPAKNVTITATFSPASGISTVSVANAENAVRYNLAGQKVDAGYKGLHIINGKRS